MNHNQIFYSILILFLAGCSGYTKEDGKVYLRSSNEARIGVNHILVKAADYESFEVLENNVSLNLAKDKNYVFKDASILIDADPNTFEQVDNYFWRDKHHVFLLQFGGVDCKIKNADPESFKVLKESLWSKDKKSVYYRFTALENVMPDHFQAINDNWGKDRTHYFYQNQRIDSLDYKSAEIVSSKLQDGSSRPSEYIKDKDHVFYKNNLVEGANAKTFIADGVGTFGHDDKYMFEGNKNKGSITEQYRKTYIDQQ